jgi:hypothetical protein
MILPFLSKYLEEDLDFTYGEVGWIMVLFGVGSMIGSWLGGKLTDKIGFYKVMFWSLLISGFLFIGLQFVDTFWSFCISMLFIMSIADMFRPAIFVSLNTYSKIENRTRSLTLIRLAISFFKYLVKEKENSTIKPKIEGELPIVGTSVFRDKPYWIFLSISFLMGMIFFQLFTTMLLYHKEQYNLTEFHTGLLFFLNGLMIVFFEMPTVHWFEQKIVDEAKLILYTICLIQLRLLLALHHFTQMLLMVR